VNGGDPACLEDRDLRPWPPPNSDPVAVSESRLAILGALGDWDWRPELATLPVPILIVHGEEDPLPVEGAQEYEAHLPAARLLVLAGVGHFPWIEAPEAFLSAVRAFLRGE